MVLKLVTADKGRNANPYFASFRSNERYFFKVSLTNHELLVFSSIFLHGLADKYMITPYGICFDVQPCDLKWMMESWFVHTRELPMTRRW